MSELFFETPVMIGLIGLASSTVLGFVWTQVGHRQILWATAAGLVLTGLLVMINIQVVTDREALRGTMDDIASALSKNDLEKVYSYMHPNASAGVRRAKTELPRYKFSEARITRVHSLLINQDTTPVSAISEFNVVVTVSLDGHVVDARRFVRVYFRKSGDKWCVYDYEHFEPTAGFRKGNLTTQM